MNEKDELVNGVQELFAELAASYPKTALSTITGLFVGFIEFSVTDGGGDCRQEIKIDGCGSRDIILCEVTK